MAELEILYWRDIPAQVNARSGRNRVRRQLPERFQEAIDDAAMAGDLTGTDDYLEQWRKGAPAACGEDLAAEAEVAARRLEADYPDARLAALIAAAGREPG